VFFRLKAELERQISEKFKLLSEACLTKDDVHKLSTMGFDVVTTNYSFACVQPSIDFTQTEQAFAYRI
jgi:hypothetical protein